MSKLGLPYEPSTLVWTKISLDYMYSIVQPTYLSSKFAFKNKLSNSKCFLTNVRILLGNNQVKYYQGRDT